MFAHRTIVTSILVMALLAQHSTTWLGDPVTLAPEDGQWAAGFGIPGLNDYVKALVVGPDNTLYAGGDFTSAEGVVVNRIARWDGSRWRPLGSGMGGGVPPQRPSVEALAFGPDDSLYAAGWFETAGGVAASHIARWDGAAWHSLAGGIDGYSLQIGALSFGPDGSLYTGGSFAVAGGGETASNIASWDPVAASWHRLGEGNGIAASGSLYSLAPGQDGSLYAGGYFSAAGTTVARHIARWDGTAWRPLGGEVNSVVMVVAVGPDGSVYAGGYFNTAGGAPANGIARWDGATWSPLGSGLGGSRDEIFALAIGPDGTLYAGGDFTLAGGAAANRVARWDGSAWHPLGSGITGCVYDGCVRALAFGPDGSLYAGGHFSMEDNGTANNIARWDGAAWHPLGAGLNSAVQALAVGPDNSLYAGGWFTSADGVSANRVARWDGVTWHPLGAGLNSLVRALAVGPDGSLYAGGAFTTAGEVSANYVARWDGATWHPLNSGFDGGIGVQALTVTPSGSLYAGGSFKTAGGIPSSNIARWNTGLLRRYLPMILHQ